MKKDILTEQAVYTGFVNTPKNFEINDKELIKDIYESKFTNNEFKFSKNWDLLNTYIREFLQLKFNLHLHNKKTWGNIFNIKENYHYLLEVDLNDLKNSPDYVCLYGASIENCLINIHYDDNKNKGKEYKVQLKNNMFVIFSSSNYFDIINNQKNDLNYILNMTYVSI
jgi:hypothetical protein